MEIDTTLPACPNCGAAAASGEYCSRCGQKRITRHHLSFGAFARDAFKEVVDLEHSKIFRTPVRPALHKVYRQSWPVRVSKGIVLYVGHFIIYPLVTFSLLGPAFRIAGSGL